MMVPIAQKQPIISTDAKQTKTINNTICFVGDGDDNLMNLALRLLHFCRNIKSGDGDCGSPSIVVGDDDASTENIIRD